MCKAAVALAGMQRWYLQAKGKRATALNQNRQDKGNATMTLQEKLKGREEVATQDRTSMIDAGGAKEKVRRRHSD